MRPLTLVAVVLSILIINILLYLQMADKEVLRNHKVHKLPAKIDEPVNKIWPILQKDGSIRWMTRGQAIIEALLTEREAYKTIRKLQKVRFFLYTQQNPTIAIEVHMGDVETLVRSTFNFTNPTRFMITGWNGRYAAVETRMIRQALLLNGENKAFNFFSVDWSVYSESLNYVIAHNLCSKTGKIIAEFIDWLHVHGHLQFETLTLYGHSLGAHVAGFAGKNVQRGRVHTIIGLDPVLHLFEYEKPESRLSNTDAEYVESIQTNGGLMGFYKPIGHASFYPNGGKSQPGCGLDIEGGCAHGRSVIYLAEALSLSDGNGFHSVACSDFAHVKEASCNLFENRARLGDPDNAKYALGIYYLETNSESPFGIGNVWTKGH